jgi:hypothetical protein
VGGTGVGLAVPGLGLGWKARVAVALPAGETVTVGVRLAAGEPVTVAVTVKVAVTVGEVDGLGVRLGDGEGEGDAVGVSCCKTTGAAAKAVSQPSASDSPKTKTRAFARAGVKAYRRQAITRFARRRDSMVRVIILLLFYVKNFISCLIIHPNFIHTYGNHWYRWTSPLSP